MLRKIDCVMIRVDDVPAASAFYQQALGLTLIWWDDHTAGFRFPESDAEIVLHDGDDLPSPAEVHYLVDDVAAAVTELEARGCAVLVAPFTIRIGTCAVVRDPFGVRLCLLD